MQVFAIHDSSKLHNCKVIIDTDISFICQFLQVVSRKRQTPGIF